MIFWSETLLVLWPDRAIATRSHGRCHINATAFGMVAGQAAYGVSLTRTGLPNLYDCSTVLVEVAQMGLDVFFGKEEATECFRSRDTRSA